MTDEDDVALPAVVVAEYAELLAHMKRSGTPRGADDLIHRRDRAGKWADFDARLA